MAEQCAAIKAGKSIDKPIYNHVSGLLDPAETIQPCPPRHRPVSALAEGEHMSERTKPFARLRRCLSAPGGAQRPPAALPAVLTRHLPSPSQSPRLPAADGEGALPWLRVRPAQRGDLSVHRSLAVHASMAAAAMASARARGGWHSKEGAARAAMPWAAAPCAAMWAAE